MMCYSTAPVAAGLSLGVSNKNVQTQCACVGVFLKN